MDENIGYEGGLVLNGPELNKDPFFSISATSSTNRGQVKEKIVVYPSLVCVRARARAPTTSLKFTTLSPRQRF